MPSHLHLVLVCRDAPPLEHEGRPMEFGIQDSRQVLHPGAPLPGGALRFDVDAAVKIRRDGTPDLGGPFVHGPAGARFLYLGWRAIGGATWTRRYKIPLAGIAPELLAAGTLSAAVSTAERTTTLSLSEGWTPARA